MIKCCKMGNFRWKFILLFISFTKIKKCNRPYKYTRILKMLKLIAAKLNRFTVTERMFCVFVQTLPEKVVVFAPESPQQRVLRFHRNVRSELRIQRRV